MESMDGSAILSLSSDLRGLFFLEQWDQGFGWIFLMGFLVTVSCGLIGNFMILRRMTLMGDALSHSLLPGVVLAFLFTQSRAPIPMAVGAILASMAAALLIEFIEKHSRLKRDAVIGIVFTSFFALGVVLISLFANKVDLDADCVLYGELGLTPFAHPVSLFGGYSVPTPVLRMLVVLSILVVLIVLFYKEWVITAFDPSLAHALGISVRSFHYGFMLLLSLVVVSTFESVGVILVMAMLVFPGATVALMTDRLRHRLLLSCLFSALYAFFGVHLALIWDANIAGAMTVVAGGLFFLVWVVYRLGQLFKSYGLTSRNAVIKRQYNKLS